MIEQAKNPIEVTHSIWQMSAVSVHFVLWNDIPKKKMYFFVRQRVFHCDIEHIFVTEEAKNPKVLDFFEIFFFLSQTIKINGGIFPGEKA